MAVTLTSSYKLICSKNTSTYSTLRVYGKVNSQDTASNTSSVSIQARLYGNGGSGSFSSGSTATTLNGSTQNQSLGNTSYSKGSEKTLSTKTFTITHNADGTYTNKAVSVKLTSSSTPSGTASGTINVATIPRASQPSANPNSVNIGSSTTISTNRASSSFTHTISYSFGSLSGNVGTNIADSIYWTIPNTFVGQFSSTERQKSCTLTCITYSGSTNIGTKTTTITINIPDSSRPTYTTPTKSETDASVISAIGSSMNKAIINLSKPRYQMTLASHDGATLTSATIRCGDLSNTINLSGTSYNLDYTFVNPMTSNVVQIIITDSRGLQTTYTDTYNNYEIYTKPTITYQKIARSGLAGDVRIQLNGILQATNIGGGTTNNISASFRYKENASGSSWSSSTDLTSSISYNGNHNEWYLDVTETGIASYDKSWIFEITIADGSTPSTPIVRTYTINRAVPTMSLGENDMQVNGELYIGDTDGNNKLRSRHILNGQRTLMCSGTGGTSGVYIKLCHISLASHDQGRFNNFKIFIGDGNNGRTDQQAYIDLTLQQGYTGSEGGRFGGTWELHSMKTGFKLSNTNILVISSTNKEYDVWFYTTRTYCRPSYIYNVDEGTTITHIGNVTQTTAPSGTLCNVEGVVEDVPVVLYNDASGTNGSVTLSSSAGNYTYLEIFYRGNDSQYSSVKVFEPNGKNVSLLVSLTYNNQIYFKQKIVTISGTSITNTNNSQGNFNASQQGWSNVNYIYITRVLGYY